MSLYDTTLTDVSFERFKRWFCGIDWAERHLDFCLEKESGDVVKRHRVDNNEDGFSSLMKTFSQHAIKTSEIAIAIESPHEPGVDFLLARSIGSSIPKRVKDFFLPSNIHPSPSIPFQAKSGLTEALVAQLKPLIAALNGYRKRIEELLEKFKDGTRFKSLPGVDVILAAKLLVTIGTDRERFESANEMQCFFGTAPYTKASGKYKSVHFRKACHKGTRTALQQMALPSLTNFRLKIED